MEAILKPHDIYFIVAVAGFLSALIATALFYFRRAKRSSAQSWDALIKRLKLVDRKRVERIALDVLDESGGFREEEPEDPLDPLDIWPLIGGLEGLEVLKHNCDVLIDLAFYVQKWHPEGVAVAEQLRMNAREINWHISRLEGAAQTGNLHSAFPSYAQRAVATYYLMTQRLLALYEQGRLPEHAALQGAL